MNTPVNTLKAFSEYEIKRKVDEKIDSGKFELVGEPKKRWNETYGQNIWYAKVRFINWDRS